MSAHAGAPPFMADTALGAGRGRLARTGLAVGAACGLLAVACVVGDRLLMPPSQQMHITDVVWFAALLLYPVMGTVVVYHRPAHRIGWLYLVIGGCITLAPLLEGVAVLLGDSVQGRGVELASQALFGLSWALLTTAAILFFPDGRLPSRRWWPVAALGAVGTLMATLAAPFSQVLATVALALLGLTSVFALASVVVRWRAAAGQTRRELSWLVSAVVVVVAALGVGTVNHTTGGPYAVGVVLEACAIAAFPLATGVAIVRDRLFDIEVVLNRSLVYLALVLAAGSVFVLTVAVVGGIAGDSAGQSAALVTSATSVLALAPLRDRMVRGVDRLLYGERSRPYVVLAGVAARLEGAGALDDLLRTASATVAEDLKLPFAAVLADGRDPAYDGPAEEFPLLHDGRQEGLLVAGLRRGQTAFSGRERMLLTDVARHLAVAVRARRLSTEAEQAREHVVRAREEERLRIRRDLHDGVGPTLAAVRLQVDTLADRIGPDDPAAAAAVARIKSELTHAMADVRRSVEGLRPPVLDQVGLAGIVRQRAELLGSAGITVEVQCPQRLDVGSAAVEVAAYRIVTEALTNVVRHARASRCLVALQLVEETLVVRVSDDGAGLFVTSRDGVGLRSMSERATELGGQLVLGRGLDGRGTSVEATIPVPEDR